MVEAFEDMFSSDIAMLVYVVTFGMLQCVACIAIYHITIILVKPADAFGISILFITDIKDTDRKSTRTLVFLQWQPTTFLPQCTLRTLS